MLNEREHSALRVIQQTPQWQVVLRLKDMVIDKIKSNPIKKDSEWEMTKSMLEQEGKINGIKEFFQEVFNNSK